MTEAAHDGARGRRLARVHAGARDRDHGDAVSLEREVEAQRFRRDARRHADALAEIWEIEHAAQHLAVERLAVRRIDRIANADHAAEIQELHDVPRRELGRQMSGVAE